jgi:hypothetical protein
MTPHGPEERLDEERQAPSASRARTPSSAHTRRPKLLNKQPGIVKYLQLLVAGAFLALTCLLAVYLLAVGIVRLHPDSSRTWPVAGDPAPDFVLKDTEGQDFHLQSQVGETPLVLQFGSFT